MRTDKEIISDPAPAEGLSLEVLLDIRRLLKRKPPTPPPSPRDPVLNPPDISPDHGIGVYLGDPDDLARYESYTDESQAIGDWLHEQGCTDHEYDFWWNVWNELNFCE